MHDITYPVPVMPYPQASQMPMHHPYMPQPMPLITLDEAIWGYLRFKESKGKDKRTIADIELSLRTLSYVRPDIQYVNQITKRLILEYETLITDIPVNFRKFIKLRHLRFDELRRVSWEYPKLSPASIDKYSITLRAFINWCQDTDRMPNWKLPKFEGLDSRNSKDKRHPYTKEELRKLFTSAVFTGHKPDRLTQLWRHKLGTELVKDHYYWVPWIGLYTGMRLREIIQLLVTDLREEEGLTYMDLNEDGEGKSLKNHASKRRVPVHSELIKMGFLDYLALIRSAGHKRVFFDARTSAAGNPTDLFSKRFSRYLKAIGIKHKKLSFHSLRHTFIDQAARQAGLPDHMIKALVGHADQSITFGTYGGRISVAELSNAIEKIQYSIE